MRVNVSVVGLRGRLAQARIEQLRQRLIDDVRRRRVARRLSDGGSPGSAVEYDLAGSDDLSGGSFD
ncbi:MAG: hypothetical protein AAFV45_06305 [Pseudomonadota bacterium]